MPEGFGGSLLPLLLIFAAFLVLMYFLSVRPMQRKMREQQTMINQIETGTRVMLTSGIFGTVRYLGENQAVIELAPGQEITVLKMAIKEVVNPEMEEFVFDDNADSSTQNSPQAMPEGDPKLDPPADDLSNPDQG